MLSDLAWREIARSLHLSMRELQVVRATFDDRKESAIAADLGISPRTVHTHIERLHRKLEVADRLQLVLRIMHEFLRLTISPQGNLPPICANAAAGCCPLGGQTRDDAQSLFRGSRRQRLSSSGCALSAQ
jgi:DNA-binding CsgD family transcriptional regulator